MSDYDRIPYLVIFKEVAGFKDTYSGEIGSVTLKAHLLKPKDRPSDTVIVFMHPIGGGEIPADAELVGARRGIM